MGMAGQHVQVCMPWDQHWARRLGQTRIRDGNQRPAQQPKDECEPEEGVKRQRAGSDLGQKHEGADRYSTKESTQACGKLA